MTYIHKTVSVSEVLWKVAKIFPEDTAWWNDALVHIGWAIQAIGYHTNFITKSTNGRKRLIVQDHRVKAPCEAERILAVEYFNDNLYDSANFMDAYGIPIEMEEEEYCNRKTAQLKLGTDTTAASLSKESPRTTYIQPAADYYVMNGEYIVTSFPEGELKVHYKAFNVDKDGLPLIIDDFNYKECIYWYVVQQLIMQGFKNPNVPLQLAMAQYNKYLPKAQNASKMPSIDGMEKFAGMWLSYTRDFSLGENFFMHGEQRQKVDF